MGIQPKQVYLEYLVNPEGVKRGGLDDVKYPCRLSYNKISQYKTLVLKLI